jgi:amino acid adenylation domain-containing protein
MPKPLRDTAADSAALPLSVAQTEVWVAQKLAPTDDLFNIGGYFEISGSLDPQVFAAALRRALQEAGPPLARFRETSTGVQQLPIAGEDVRILSLDLTRESDPRAAAIAWMEADISRPFDLAEGPPCRFALLELGGGRLLWYCAFHHVVMDFYGTWLLAQRTAELYSAAKSGAAAPPATSTPWSEVLREELEYLDSDRFQRDRTYWHELLGDRPAPTTLSGRDPTWSKSTLSSRHRLPGSTLARLAELGAASDASLVAVLFSAAALYLWRVTGERDLVLGMPVAARPSAKLRRAMGFLSSVIPLRLTVDPAGNAAQLIRQCGVRIREALRHQRYRASALRSDLGLTPSDPNIYGLMVNFMPDGGPCYFAGRPAQINALRWAWVPDFAIAVHSRSDGSEASVQFDANASNHDRGALEAHARSFLAFLEALLERPEAAVSELPLSSDPQQQRLLAERRARADERLKTRGQRLEPPESEARLQGRREVPQTTTEARVAAIWSEILRVPVIGRADNFFARGGQSLLALQVVARIRDAFHIELPLKELFDEPTLQSLAARLDGMLSAGGGQRIAPIVATRWSGPAPLSYSQERMWLIDSLNPGNTAYNMGAMLWMRGELDVAAACSSFDELIARHEVMRSRVQLVDDQPRQVVEPAPPGGLRCIDLRSHADPTAEALRRAQADLRTPFDLSRGPIFRAQLLQTDGKTFLFGLVVHHIASDQWSMGILGRELAELYNRRRRGDSASLEPLPIGYRDFAQWERGGGRATQADRQLEFWRHALADLPTVDLPTDLSRPKLWTMNGASLQRQIPPQLFAAVERLARESGCTPFMVYLAGFAALLKRITGQSDLPIGVPVANRTLSAVERLLGAFVNTVVMRVDAQGDPAFGELLLRVRRTALDAFANQDVSFDKLVQELARRGDPSRAPLTQVMFEVMNAPMHGMRFDGLEWEQAVLDRGGAQFELSFAIDTEITRSLLVEFNTDLFERDTIERLVEQYLALLESAASEPRTRVSGLEILPARQWAALRSWNDTGVSFPATATFPSLFAAQAARSRERVAVSCGGTTMSYGELDDRSAVLASTLRRAGARRGERVAVCVKRSPLLLVSLLAVQRSGGAYVPLDPDFPPQRLKYMLADSGCTVIVTSGPLPRDLTLPEGVTVVDVATGSAEHGEKLPDAPTPQDAAYVLYTSGSTGRPKGVTVPHGALINFLQSMQITPGLSDSDVLAAVTTISFDIAGLELYLPLLVGARIELVLRDVASDGASLAKLLDSAAVTLMQATPATWRLLVDAGWPGNGRLRALCGGEALSRKLADDILDRVAQLWNLYGPTETTIWSTVERIEPGSAPISIGRPIANTQVYVLDDSRAVVPIGVVGEICIGGAGVAAGYLGLPTLTAERFIADIYSEVPGGRIYRTGDVGRWGADGKLYHLGRSDTQVKIRGFRIELGEIEQALVCHPSVKQAVAMVREAGPDDPRLVSYVVLHDGEELTFGEMRRYLRGLLPDYMVPAVVMPLLVFPLSPNGKLDRAALPDPFAAPGREEAASAPPSNLEQLLAQIWKSVLKVEHVGRADNFFALGGYSLLALRVTHQVERSTGRRLEPRVLFFHDLGEVAEMLEREPATRADAR